MAFMDILILAWEELNNFFLIFQVVVLADTSKQAQTTLTGQLIHVHLYAYKHCLPQ